MSEDACRSSCAQDQTYTVTTREAQEPVVVVMRRGSKPERHIWLTKCTVGAERTYTFQFAPLVLGEYVTVEWSDT